MHYISRACPLQIKDEDCWVHTQNSTDAIVITCHRNSTCKVSYDKCLSFCIPPKNGLVISPQSPMFYVKVSGTVTISIFNYSAEAGILELGVGDYRNITDVSFKNYYVRALVGTICEYRDYITISPCSKIIYIPKGHTLHICSELPIVHRGKCVACPDLNILREEFGEEVHSYN